MKNLVIKDIVSAVFDTGRRGAPRSGCDCVQCFGYCLVDADAAFRETIAVNRAPSQFAPLAFEPSARRSA